MANAKSMWRSFVIISFASAIVALGAQELKHRYDDGRMNKRDMSTMVKGMHGNDLRARMSETMINDRAFKEGQEEEPADTDTEAISRKEGNALTNFFYKLMP